MEERLRNLKNTITIITAITLNKMDTATTAIHYMQGSSVCVCTSRWNLFSCQSFCFLILLHDAMTNRTDIIFTFVTAVKRILLVLYTEFYTCPFSPISYNQLNFCSIIFSVVIIFLLWWFVGRTNKGIWYMKNVLLMFPSIQVFLDNPWSIELWIGSGNIFAAQMC